jgi:hypothetical protein
MFSATPAGGRVMSNDINGTNDDDGTLHLPEAAYERLPGVLGSITDCLDEGHERDVFLTGALPVVAGALPNVRFRYGGHWQSLNLYTGVIAPSGAGKGAMRFGRKIGRPLNEYLHKKTSEERKKWRRRKRDEENEEEAGSKPPYWRLFFGADTSAAELKSSLEDCPHGVIFDSEFKTLSTALGREWGAFRDVLLKSFQNEPVEVDRKQEEPTLVRHPALSVAVSGTPGTFAEVISNLEDGLFSRFALYRFDSDPEWESQFGSPGPSALDKAIEEAAETLKETYKRLSGRPEPLYLTFAPRVKEIIDKACSFVMKRWRREEVRPEMYSSLKRAALRALRIGAGTCLLRRHEQGQDFAQAESVEVGIRDAEVGLRLAFVYLAHSLQIASRVGSEEDRSGLNRRQREFLGALPRREFETSGAKEIAGDLGINERTAQRWLKKWWKETSLIDKVDRGIWKRPQGDREPAGVPGVMSVMSVMSVIFGGGDGGNSPASEAPGGGPDAPTSALSDRGDGAAEVGR